jgi:hypothetical protein
VPQLDMTSPYPGKPGHKALPCKSLQTIFDLLTIADHTWRYYVHTMTDFRAAPEAIQGFYRTPAGLVEIMAASGAAGRPRRSPISLLPK